MSNKPTTCVIGLKTYEIKWESADWAVSSGWWGYHNPTRYTIQVLDENIQPKEQACILLHEIMHALFDVIPDDCVVEEKVTEEAACEVVSKQLTTFFVQNPEVLKWYKEQLELP